MGVYDSKTDSFKTVSKIGTGLTDEEWRELKVHSSKFVVHSRPANYDVNKLMNCDVWLPGIKNVWENASERSSNP